MSEPSPREQASEDRWHKSYTEAEHVWSIFDLEGELICDCPSVVDAEYIVREHNAHAALVEACERRQGELLAAKAEIGALGYELPRKAAEELAELTAALAKARPKGKE